MLINIKEYDIGVSFSGKDREYVKKVVSLLRLNNLRVFYDEDYTFSNLRDELSEIYTNKVKYFSIIFMSENYKADYSSNQNNYTDMERKVIQSVGLKKSDFIIYARFDDTNIAGYIETEYAVDLRSTSLESFVENIVKRVNKKIFQETQERNLKEGNKSPLEWIIGWNGTVNPPQKPPRHRLLNKVFVENDVYQKKLDELLNGGKRSGITGFVGMGGVGKTYTAQKICWELIEKHNWEVCYVVLLEKGTEEVLDDLLDKFGLAFITNLSLQEKVTAIQKFFEKVHQAFPNLLVVLDNAENFPNLNLLLLALGDDTPVLITSRTREMYINYDEIKPLEKEKAVEYCKQILSQEEISDKKNDIECLSRLSKDLGGHPLALRLALSNFSQNIMAMNRKNRFCKLREELKLKGIVNLSSDIALSNTIDEVILHKNIISTFEWTYRELSHENRNIESNGAYILLPILSILGTNYVTSTLCKKAIKELLDNSKEDLKWISVLEALLKKDELFETSINILAKLSLLEILSDEDEDVFAIHPLIREFALSHLEKYSEKSLIVDEDNEDIHYDNDILEVLENNENYNNLSTQEVKIIEADEDYILLPNDTEVYNVAIAILLDIRKDEIKFLPLDVIIDLLYRTSKNKHITIIFIEKIKKLYENLYYLPLSWTLLKEMLEILYTTTTNSNLKKEKYWVCFKLGELKDRMGYEDGIQLIKEGVPLFLEVENKRFATDRVISDFAIHKNNWDAVWSSLYAQTYKKTQQIDKDDFRHLMQTLRLLYNDKKSYNQIHIFKYAKLIINNLSEIEQMRLSSKNQTLLSNTILDLVKLLNLKIRQHETFESIQVVDNLYRLALKKYKNQISIEHRLDYLINKNIELFDFNIIDYNTFNKEISNIKYKLRKNGIRIFKLESLYQNSLAKKEIEKGNFTQAIIHLEKEEQVLSLVPDNSSKLRKLENRGLKLLCMAQNKSIDIEFHNFKNELREHRNNEGLALEYLIEALLINSREYALKSEKAFLEYWGYVPSFSRHLLMKIKGWRSIGNDTTIDNLVEWQVDYNTLPNRVISNIDGRKMRLIRSGIQWDKDGKEIWLYPFYIDEEPLKDEDLEEFLDENEYTISNDSSDKVIFVNSTNVAKLAKKLNKKIPTQTELYASYLQIKQNIEPEKWNNQNQTEEGMIKRIKNLIETGKNLKCEDTYSLNNYSNYKVYHNLPFDEIEDFFTLEWLKNNDILYQQYEENILSSFNESPISEEQKILLAEILTTSLSLNISEKIRVINAGRSNSLSTFQCEELIKVFSEEKTKFYELAKEHPDDIKKLLNKQFDEFLTIIHIYRIKKIDNFNLWYCYTSVGHTDEWLKKEDCNISATAIDLEEKPDDLFPVMRFVKPIFTKSDLDGLQSID